MEAAPPTFNTFVRNMMMRSLLAVAVPVVTFGEEAAARFQAPKATCEEEKTIANSSVFHWLLYPY
jgi:hypothetical protein